MPVTTNDLKLQALNDFRAAEGKSAYADWRSARHQPMLDEYIAMRDRDAAAVVTADTATNNQIDAERLKVEDVAPVSVSTEKLPGYKTLAKTAPAKSTLEKPVEFIHAWLNENPDTKRKAAVATLVGLGVNYATARTQFQRWFNARKG